jgi:hypothetical protein
MTSIQHRTLLLLAVAALGAAGMLLGPDGWYGIDVGPIGSAVLYAAAWILVVHFAPNTEGVFAESSPLAERQVWIALAFVAPIALHFVSYEANTISNSASRPFAIKFGMLIFGWIVVAGVVRARNAEAVEFDERDLRIHHAADRLANGVTAMLGLLIAKTLTENLYVVARYWKECR